uniref:Cytochrome c oxidase assembly protein COX20, mitochondrial n=1 Tax=Strigamia maritima TaxID=126957 RepID=T1IQK9_STRMM
MSQDADEDADDYVPFSPTIPFYGKKVRDVPCFRNSFLYGISGGFGVGILYFLATSKTRRATDFGFASFTAITLGYWFHCRYTMSRDRFHFQQIKADVEEYMHREGTSKKPKGPS